MPQVNRWALGLVTAAVLVALPPDGAGQAQSGSGTAQAPPAFTPEFLRDPAALALGREVWEKRCRFCHGRAAYPGKAPRLDPSAYTPEFVWDRVVNGFRGMPPWTGEFSTAELKAVVAYVLSPEFSP